MTKGMFITIEGTDGSGKGTQFARLKARLVESGYDVETFDFPQYDQPSSYFASKYLNGEYGTTEEVGPYTGSLFYALDRYDASFKIRKALDAGKIVLANRFTGSNMAHQGTKFSSVEQRRGYFIWLDNLEFTLLNIPRPDVNFVLRVPADIAQGLVDQKGERSYTDKKRDIHEADLAHLERSVQVFDDLCNLFPRDFRRIDCVRSGKLMTIDQVETLLWDKIAALLPEPTPSQPKSQPAKATNPYVVQKYGRKHVSDTGREYLKDAVTNVDGNVYAFTDKLSPITIAAAMARLSRRGDDMRLTILDEFAAAADKDDKLLRRVITAYGDDSVQQLVGQHFVVEKASNLLTKKLEWGRLAAYLEQSTRYIYFDEKDENGRYRYHVPQHLPGKLRLRYESVLDEIFETYSKVVREATKYLEAKSDVPEAERDGAWRSAVRAQACDAARPLLPVATESTVGVFASGQALESLIMHLLSDDLPEAREVGTQLLTEARKVVPTFLERADKPERGGATTAYLANTRHAVAKLAAEYLPSTHADEQQPVTLTDIWPRNELALVPDMLYEHSDLPLEAIRDAVDSWPLKRKREVLAAYMGERLNRRHRPGRALEKAHYSWDLVCDYGIFRDLQRHRMVDDLAWQQLTPRYGYETPELIEQAGLGEQFEVCFDLSLKLHSELQAAGFVLEAQYATLLGHRMRWKVTMNARETFHFNELRTSPQGHPGYRKLVMQMHEELGKHHPLLTQAMKFVSTDEDPELTRLAAERATQYKLEKLDSSTS